MKATLFTMIPAAILLAACGSAKRLPENGGEKDNSFRNEQIEIGYGSSSRNDLGFAVSKIEVDDITVRSYQSIADYIRGRVPGVEVNPNGTLRIRGQNSVTEPSEALIVIDGIICSDINGVNPNNVHSVQVLKDGSSSIYGMRGANGVVLITTKSGYEEEQARIAAKKALKEQRKAKKQKNSEKKE